MAVHLNVDPKGFISQECPGCLKRFKVNFSEGTSDEPIGHCPYCCHQGERCWWTEPQARFIRDAALAVEVRPMLEDMAREINRSDGPLSMDLGPKKSAPVAPDEPDEDWAELLFECCGEPIRFEGEHAELHCFICGTPTQVMHD